jgi:N-methylhydantoinase A
MALNKSIKESKIFIGVDVGGTHTDMIMAMGSDLFRSKAFTTHHDYSEGIFDALSVMAKNQNLGVNELLSKTDMFVNGTTIVTNAITELRGSKVGVLVTKGFKDTFRLARGARRNEYDDHKQINPPDVVARDCIEEVEERVDSGGNVLVSINEEELRQSIRRLKSKGVEALAVCYLWSFKNQEHEKRTLEVIQEEFPGAFTTLSSEIHPVIREFERWMTAVFNSFCYKVATNFLRTVSTNLNENNFKGNLSFFQGIGGSISIEMAEKFPILLLSSGPAGGVMGAKYLAEKMDLKNILIGDMGGTSFDTTLIEDLQINIAKRVAFDELETGINVVDVMSVGAGGGSIAWIDQRGVPQVGPKSAGSNPGPVCAGRGGTDPTVTDAMVVMGFIDPANYLDGRYKLDVEAAREVIQTKIADRFNWSIEEAAAGIHDLVVANMANALREVSIERGYNPQNFAMFAYGGTLPLFAVQICRHLGIKKIVIPNNSSVFSAFGLLTSDYIRQYNRTVEWNLSNSDDYTRVNAIAEDILNVARKDAKDEGVSNNVLHFYKSGDFRFEGQVHEISVPLAKEQFNESDALELAEEFPSIYEKTYGKGTAWKGAPVTLLNYSVKVVGEMEKPNIKRVTPALGDCNEAIKGFRSVYLPDIKDNKEIPIFDEGEILPGMSFAGPGIIDAHDTTIFVPGGVTCTRDEWFNFVLDI